MKLPLLKFCHQSTRQLGNGYLGKVHSKFYFAGWQLMQICRFANCGNTTLKKFKKNSFQSCTFVYIRNQHFARCLFQPLYSVQSQINRSWPINAATSWTISIEADGNATITSTRLIKFNEKGANGGTFTAYATSATQATADINKVSIYRKQVK